MNLNSKIIVAILLAFCAFSFPACDKGAKESGAETDNTPPPDPNTVFANFENVFMQQELPFLIPYDYPPFGNSLADEVKENFLPKEGNIFPAFRFPLKDGFRGFVTFEDASGNFQMILNVFDSNGKPVDSRMVAGPDGNQVVDAEFNAGGIWTEIRRNRAEDTGMPTGDGTTSKWTIDGKGKIVAN